MFICLVGSSGHSGKHFLTCWQSLVPGKGIHRNMLENLVIESDKELGEIILLILGIEQGSVQLVHDALFVNEVAVANRQTNHQDAFPCYHWIKCGQSVSITAKTGELRLIKRMKVLHLTLSYLNVCSYRVTK